MGKERKSYSKDFKAKVALEAARETQTLSQLATRHKLHPGQITQWKKQLLSNAPLLFERGGPNNGPADEESLTAPLYQEIGRLKMEVEFLKKKR